MRVFKVINGQVQAISLVDYPAIEADFVALSKQLPIQLSTDKMELIGPVLIPDKLIYRRLEGREFYISFDAETIEQLANDYLANGFQYNFTLDHKTETQDVVVVQSWVTLEDGEYPKGTWMIKAKVNNEDLWQSIKSGEFKGFSIESVVELDKSINEFDFSSQMSTEELFEKIKELFKEAFNPQTPEEVIEEKAAEVVEDVAEEVVTEEVVEMKEEEPTEEPKEDERIKELEDQLASKDAEIAALNDKIAELEAGLKTKDEEAVELAKQVAESKEEIVKLSKQPSVEPVKVVNQGSNYSAALKVLMN
jgi:uncharacterized coiled-coil protein SlyX